jgi:hypothetical protein
MVAAALVTAFAFPARSASAQNFYWKESDGTMATYVYRFTVTLAPCTNNSFETSNLSTGADTVMYLVSVSTGLEIGYNDDYEGAARSRIDYNLSCFGSSQTVTAYVMAKSNASGGTGGKTFRFKFNGITEGTFHLGGYIVATGSNVTSPTDTVETVLVNNGARATLLIRLVWNGTRYRFDGADQTSGVGVASKLPGSSAFLERWVVGAPTMGAGEGPVRVVRNDKNTIDSDGDGLGNGLEGEACTCRAVGLSACGTACPSGLNPQDTDGDGLSDYDELIGVDDDRYPSCLLWEQCYHQEFPKWGASPLHKDIFVEVDLNESEGATAFLQEETAKVAADVYARLEIPNRDGVSGVALHFDIGHGCFDDPFDHQTEPDGITTICGDFGGVTLDVTRLQKCIDLVQPDCCLESQQAFLDELRHGKFFWIMRGAENGHAEEACAFIGGGSEPEDPSVGNWLVAHEIGHCLGLQHWGQASAGIMNRKPFYPSVMNYTYDTGFNDQPAQLGVTLMLITRPPGPPCGAVAA